MAVPARQHRPADHRKSAQHAVGPAVRAEDPPRRHLLGRPLQPGGHVGGVEVEERQLGVVEAVPQADGEGGGGSLAVSGVDEDVPTPIGHFRGQGIVAFPARAEQAVAVPHY